MPHTGSRAGSASDGGGSTCFRSGSRRFSIEASPRPALAPGRGWADARSARPGPQASSLPDRAPGERARSARPFCRMSRRQSGPGRTVLLLPDDAPPRPDAVAVAGRCGERPPIGPEDALEEGRHQRRPARDRDAPRRSAPERPPRRRRAGPRRSPSPGGAARCARPGRRSRPHARGRGAAGSGAEPGGRRPGSTPARRPACSGARPRRRVTPSAAPLDASASRPSLHRSPSAPGGSSRIRGGPGPVASAGRARAPQAPGCRITPPCRSPEREGEIPLRPVSVHGEDAPPHGVPSQRQRAEVHGEEVPVARIHAGLAPVDRVALGVGDLDPAERGLQLPVEPDAHLARRGPHDPADPRLRALGERVRPRRDRGQSERDHRGGDTGDPHRGPPRSGRNAAGIRSSRKKWSSARTPTVFPLASLMGMIASTPISKNRPAQMMPGLIVPVVRSSSSGVESSASTIGMRRPRGPRSPTSRTKLWRYGMLYWSARPYVSALLSRPVRGISAPITPVTATGRRSASESGRSPNPLPNRRLGPIVENDSASTRRLPTPPISQSNASDRASSWGASRRSVYLSPTSGLPNPERVPSSGSDGSSTRYSPPTDRPRSGVIRFWSSTPIAVSFPSGPLM